MLGTSLRFGRVHSEDRFYVPGKARKNQNHNQNKNQQVHRAKSDGVESSAASSTNSKAASSDNRKPKEHSNCDSLTPKSNLDRFLESTTPCVPAQYFSKTTMRGLRTCDVEFRPYFTLGDLWDSFKEWSAYGAGVPLVLDGSDPVVQYYVPYLSGIQLYGESLGSTAKLRQASEDSEGDYRDSSSDGSGDYEIEKVLKFCREQWGRHPLASGNPLRMDGLCLSDKFSTTQEDFSSDDGEPENFQGNLLFEFLEQDPPYSREPLADKILDLARWSPELMTLKSCDLLPSSWISVAWYPIYRIPTGPTLRDLDACFLTYHSLSTPIKGNEAKQAPVVVYPSGMDGVPRISLTAFGMASYKFKEAMWMQNEQSEHKVAKSLVQATDNWLRLLRVNHPDFQFFASHGMYSG